MKIAIGSNHRALELKQAVRDFIIELGYDCNDFGSYASNSVDYPDIAQKVSEAVILGGYDYGILICGTGIGMSIAANKIKGIRAALCRDVFDATRARQHNDANILCLGSEKTQPDAARDIVKAFLSQKFEGERHSRRLDKIRNLEDVTFDNQP